MFLVYVFNALFSDFSCSNFLDYQRRFWDPKDIGLRYTSTKFWRLSFKWHTRLLSEISKFTEYCSGVYNCVFIINNESHFLLAQTGTPLKSLRLYHFIITENWALGTSFCLLIFCEIKVLWFEPSGLHQIVWQFCMPKLWAVSAWQMVRWYTEDLETERNLCLSYFILHMWCHFSQQKQFISLCASLIFFFFLFFFPTLFGL